MKAITQIIAYLRGRGELTRTDLKWLAGQGLLPWDQAFAIEEDDESTVDFAPPRAAEDGARPWDDGEFERPRADKRRNARAVVRKGPVLEADELCARLAGAFDGWRDELDGLVRVGRRLSACASWAEAAVAVRRAEGWRLGRAVSEGLAARDPSPAAFIRAFEMEGYREVVAAPGLHGPAVAAYRALLASAGQAPPGRFAWLLREPEVCRVVNLRVAQDRLRREAWLMGGAHPRAFARATRRVRQAPRNSAGGARADGVDD